MSRVEFPLAQRLLEGLSDAARDELSVDVRGLEGQLREQLDEARGTWPAIEVGDGDYLDYLADRLVDDSTSADQLLRQIRASDLFVACGVAQADVGAMRAFER